MRSVRSFGRATASHPRLGPSLCRKDLRHCTRRARSAMRRCRSCCPSWLTWTSSWSGCTMPGFFVTLVAMATIEEVQAAYVAVLAADREQWGSHH